MNKRIIIFSVASILFMSGLIMFAETASGVDIYYLGGVYGSNLAPGDRVPCPNTHLYGVNCPSSLISFGYSYIIGTHPPSTPCSYNGCYNSTACGTADVPVKTKPSLLCRSGYKCGFFSGTFSEYGGKKYTYCMCLDSNGDSYCENVKDCNDPRSVFHTGAIETCDEYDNNCDGTIDEGFNKGQSCTTGVGECQKAGIYVCKANGAGTVCNAIARTPSTEICDGKDNNCDGTIDEGCPCPIINSIIPCDNQNGVCEGSTKTCYSTGWGDCNYGSRYEPNERTCGDVLDNDCDELVDCEDSDCLASGACACATDSECPPGYVCENICVPACTKDDDCSSGEVCDISTGHCYVPIITPKTCSEATDITSCHSVDLGNDGSLFDCYSDGESCDEVANCESMNSDLTACVNTVSIECEWDPVSEICSSGSGGFLGCPEGKYPQVDGTCGDDVDPNLVCVDDGVCDSNEVCGCGDCVHQLGYGGCDINNWCGDGVNEIAGCVPISIGSEEKCEEYENVVSVDSCLEAGGRCANNYDLSQDPPLFSNSIFKINGQECCIGSCLPDDGFVIDSITGTMTAYTNGDCIPLETGEGNMDVLVDGKIKESKPCTILPSRRVPFSSIFGVLAGLIIIVLFYLVRKKH